MIERRRFCSAHPAPSTADSGPGVVVRGSGERRKEWARCPPRSMSTVVVRLSRRTVRALTARTTAVTTPLVRISPVHEKSAVHVVPDWALTREVNRGMAA